MIQMPTILAQLQLELVGKHMKMGILRGRTEIYYHLFNSGNMAVKPCGHLCRLFGIKCCRCNGDSLPCAICEKKEEYANTP